MTDIKRFVVLNGTNQIVNRILWDGERLWTPPAGCTVMLESEAEGLGYQEPVPPPSPMTPREFRARLTTDERRAITTAAAQNIDLRIWLDELDAATEVHRDSADVQAGMAALVGAGLITAERAAEVLS